MTTMAQLRYTPLPTHYHHFNANRAFPPSDGGAIESSTTTTTNNNNNLTFPFSASPSPSSSYLSISSFPTNSFDHNLPSKFHISPHATVAGGGGDADGTGGWSGGGGSGGGSSGGGGDDSSSSSDDSSSFDAFGPLGAFLSGWRSRVAADPQFPFKVLMEEIVGVSACVLGDMASRPNFGLNELDFVFSTLVVGCILNFTLMYLLAPTMSASSASLPSIFANCPTSHMFEPGPFSLVDRLGTFVYKGTLFAAVGFAAGLVGTALSNGLLKMRKKMDPNFETPNKSPPTLLNALTWAAHMGISSNLRYQTLNGVEFLLAKGLPSFAFKTSVIVLRVVNNVAGGMSFVILARLTGSQSSGVDEGKVLAIQDMESLAAADEKDKLLQGNSESNESVHK